MLQLQEIKEACLDADVVAVLMGLAAGPLSRHPRMTVEDYQTVQLLLTFMRNLLVVPDPPKQTAIGKQARLQVR